jgi:hypothetical protein
MQLKATVILMALLASQAAGARIEVGTHRLLPDKSGQIVPIRVEDGGIVRGVNFRVMVADGGPEVGGIIDGPVIEQVELETGTIFDSRHLGQHPLGPSFLQVATWGIMADGAGVEAQGILAFLTIDTSGWTSGSWDLKLENPFGDPTELVPLPLAIENGTITIDGDADIPEPATGILVSALAVLNLTSRRRSS